MEKTKVREKYTEAELAASLDKVALAASDLGISETDLVSRLIARMHWIAKNERTAPIEEEHDRMIFHPGAGP